MADDRRPEDDDTAPADDDAVSPDETEREGEPADLGGSSPGDTDERDAGERLSDASNAGKTTDAAGVEESTTDDDEEFWARYGQRRPVEEEDDEEFWMGYGGRRRTEAVMQGKDVTTARLQTITRSELRAHYGPLRTLFKRREKLYKTFQRQLGQARIRTTYDQFLARVVARMLGIVAAFLLVGLLAAGALLAGSEYGYLPRFIRRLGPSIPWLAAATFGGFAVVGVVSGGAYWLWRRVFDIRRRIAARRRDINYNLPYAITFAFALSRAGVGFDRIVLRLSDSADTYGAVAEEFERVAREVEMFGNNLYVGLENLREITPSPELRRVVDDIIVMLETGGDLADYLHDEIGTQLETAVAEQESFIEQLELLSEVFVVGFVAAPLFVLVVLMVITFLGAETLTVMALLVYVVIPLSLVAFVVLIDVISGPFAERAVAGKVAIEGPTPPSTDADGPEWRSAYNRSKRISGVRQRLANQVVKVRDQPSRAFLFSVPIALALVAAAVLTGAVSISFSALLANPVTLTTQLGVAPLVVATAPVAVIYEYRRRQELAIRERFPELLELLATSNRRGLSLTRGLDIVSESASGRLAGELRQLRNDIRWNADLPAAFDAFGDRLNSPTLTRTAKLIAEGSRATSDLYLVLEVAASDIAERTRLDRERRQTLQSYLVIVVIGFLVYLLVVVLLAANFLDPIERLSASVATRSGDGGPVSLAAVPVTELRVILFHSALIQGFGSGVLAGKLAENSLYSGLKYGIALVVLTVVVFGVV